MTMAAVAVLAVLALVAGAAPVKVSASRMAPEMLWLRFVESQGQVVVTGGDTFVTLLIESVGADQLMEGLNCTATPAVPLMQWRCVMPGTPLNPPAPLPFWIVPSIVQALAAPDLGFGLVQSYVDNGVTYIFQRSAQQ